MESYEASRTVFTRIQTLDPENASKIMGYILLNHTETDMLHFSYAPETLLISLVNRAKTDLGLSSNTLCALPISNPISISRPNPLSLPLSSPRLSNGFHSSSPNSPSIWSPHHFSVSPKNNINHINNNSSSLRSNGSFGGNFNEGSNNVSFLDDFCSKDQNLGSFHRTNSNISNNNGSHGENVAFLDDFTSKDQNLGTFLTDPVILPSKNVDFTEDLPSIWDINSNNNNTNSGENNSFMHRRSSSFNESMLYYGTDESTCGFGLKPCLYYARGFCKNGSNCKFVHGHGVNGGFCEDDVVFGPQIVGSPCSYDSSAAAAFEDEFFRSKFAHHQRFAAAHLMSSGGSLPYPPRSAAALMMSEDMHKLNRLRMARNEFGLMDCNPGSRQIYLTFPADSTFKEEDVSNYFNKFGPVQDVRIPYQQKRMFGFVTFVFPETVKIILAKGNPHFVCDSRVLVKPYKEKGKLPDKKQHPYQFERGDFSCSSPSSHDYREPFDFQLGGRMPYSTHELLLRKKLEERADFQNALEFQERRLMNLQLFDMKTQQNQHHLSARSPVSTNIISADSSEESTKVSSNEEDDEATHEGVNTVVNDSNENVPKKEEISQKFEENEFFESLDHVLPDNLFASPTKSSSVIRPASFSPALTELGNCTSSTDTLSAAMSSLSMAPPKSCFFEMPRISNGHGAIGM